MRLPSLGLCAAFLLSTAPIAANGLGEELRKPLPPPAEIAKLPADGGAEFNRLVFEQSPYLLQHARNPVDWYPWAPEAFELAKQLDKPIFLSVGYSTCHWCHVMEHESFEDAEVAKLMNANFVCIKVDREERPDIDQVYMTVTQMMTGRGGWPMTVVMTPDKLPYFAGTYFPKESRYGRKGMLDLVPELAAVWSDNRAGVAEFTDRIVAGLRERSVGTAGEAVGTPELERAFAALASRYDAQRGGFGDAPKFPMPHNHRFLLRYAERTGDARARTMVTQTLRAMRHGGIWDHVGFGFHRYSTDPNWLVPHFERMLYDQALLAMAYIEAWQVTGDADLRRTAEEIFTYVLRDMTSEEGGFYSAEDADSAGEEGLFYVWTAAELKAALGDEDGALAIEFWNVTNEGNFADEATGELNGRNILHTKLTETEFAAWKGMDAPALVARLASIRQRLFEVREPRIHPLKDDKILTDWNGLMIAAFALGGRVLDDERYARAATAAADFGLVHLVDEEGRLFKRYRGGEAGLAGMLEDYAFFIWGLLEVYELTFEPRYLQSAIELADEMLAHFWDAGSGGFFLAPDDGEALIVRSKEIYDGAIPSGNSVAALDLVRLARMTGAERFETRASELVRAFAGDVASAPQAYPQFLLALDHLVGPSFEVVIAGEPEAEDTQALLAALNGRFQPNKVVLLRPSGPGQRIVSLAPFTELQDARDGKATAYVCQDFACQQPTHDVATMLAYLAAADAPPGAAESGAAEGLQAEPALSEGEGR